MKISVTNEHIQRGIPRNSLTCPVALAIADQYEPCDGYELITANTRLIIRAKERSDTFRRAMLPYKVQNFIRNFDHDKPTKPFEFEMKDIPELRLKAIA